MDGIPALECLCLLRWMRQFILEKIIWRNQTQRTIRPVFDVPQKLVTDQTEIQGISKIGWYTHPWQRTTLLTDKAIQLSIAKVYVFSDSLLCLGKMNPHPESIDAWKKKIRWFTGTPQYRELDRIDGEPLEFEWKISQDSLQYRFSPKSRK